MCTIQCSEKRQGARTHCRIGARQHVDPADFDAARVTNRHTHTHSHVKGASLFIPQTSTRKASVAANSLALKKQIRSSMRLHT
mmetsp:Transcript_63247/g.100300  ORF Transcript_63247/g.100300 Transcript_63247/m.100300 type:complete len:83 (+) Transcript_63247:35-283(+)